MKEGLWRNEARTADGKEQKREVGVGGGEKV